LAKLRGGRGVKWRCVDDSKPLGRCIYSASTITVRWELVP